MSAEFVTIDACQRTREGVYKDFKEVKGVLASHDEDLTDMKVAIGRLTIISEQLHEKSNEVAPTPFWSTDIGKKIVLGMFGLMVVITLVALDQNIGILDLLLGK